MVDKAADGLPYGQFGQAIFDQDTGDWYFSRSTSHLSLEPIGKPTTISEPTGHATDLHSWGGGRDVPSRRREKQAKALARSHPDLQPALDLLPGLASVSEAVEDAAGRHDTSKGQLIASGEVYDESRRGYLPAIAFPCGPTGNNLRVIQGLKQRQAWHDDREFWVETVSYSGEEATWNGPGVAILSIEFARPFERGERYIAVRFPTQILVFRPVVKKRPSPEASRLDVGLLFSIGIDDTGGVPHAHMSSNPWFTGQLAIADQRGRWSVWETGRNSTKAKRIRSGASIEHSSAKGERPVDDGWARLVWVESATTLCICTRRKLVAIDLESAEDSSPTDIDVRMKAGIGWILDIGALQAHPSQLYVLTAHHVLVYHITKSSDGELLPKQTLQMRHHRSPDDLSLCMHLLASDNYVLLILRSSFSETIDQFWFDFSQANHVGIQLPAPFSLSETLRSTKVLDLALKVLPFHRQSDDADTDGAHARSPQFCSLFLLGNNLGFSQTMCVASDPQSSDTRVGPPTWVTDVTKRKKRPQSTLGGFLVDDEDETAQTCERPMSNYAQRRRHETAKRSGPEWTVSCEHMVRRLDDSSRAESTDIEEVIEEAAGILRSSSAERLPIRSLLDLASGYITIEDASGASARLSSLGQIQPVPRVKMKFEDADPESLTHVALRPAHHASLSTLGLYHLGSIENALEAIRRSLVEPVAATLSNSTAASRDAHGQQMAAEVVLASQCLYTHDEPKEEPVDSQDQSQAWQLPVRSQTFLDSSQDAKPSTYPSSSRAQTPALPTPSASASASASTVTGSSYPAGSAAPEVARLSKYTTFTKAAPSILPRSLDKVLSHWEIGADPATYDWRTSAGRLNRADEEGGDDDMTERERRQMQRRTERFLRRQRKEAEESQRQQMLSSQAPEIMSASQPAQAARQASLRRADSQLSAGAGAMLGSSQNQGVSQGKQMAASQVVPGRHGGRPPARKKRKSGF